MNSNESITKLQLQEILQQNGIEDEIGNISIRNADELKGEHFATIIEFLKVEFRTSERGPLFLILKKLIPNPVHYNLAKTMVIMEKEASFYNEFLPEAVHFCKSQEDQKSLAGALVDLFPKCYFANSDLILMENLCEGQKFRMLSSNDKLQDYDTSRLVLENLALFHAVSYCMVQSDGVAEFKRKWALNITEYFDPQKNPFFETMVTSGIKHSITILEKHALNSDNGTIQFLKEYVEGNSARIHKLFRDPPKPESFLVLSHGDFKSNNMLFRFNEETLKPIQHKIVDLQGTKLSSPGIDVAYFMYTSVEYKVQECQFHNLLQIYWTQFMTVVKSLNTNCSVTFEEFEAEYKRCSGFGMTMKLLLLSTLPAFKGKGFDGLGDTDDDGDGVNDFDRIINRWIAQYPEQASSISSEILTVVKDFRKLNGI